MQEALKEELLWSVRGLRSEGGELFGRSEALLNSLCKLPLAQQVHQLKAGVG
jgi:hypothetical protein